jgi:large-conductance mechanosensitive channel
MKKKDIITLAVAAIIISASIYFVVRLLGSTSKKATVTTNTGAENATTVPKDFDEKTLKRIEDLSDYGKPTLENVGKTDLFAGF